MNFYGYSSREEAEEHWGKLPEGKVTKVRVATRGKKCTSHLEGYRFTYADGSNDNGELIDQVTIIVGKNKIMF